MAKGKLTAKQMAFCRAYASGMTMADSYREAFSAENMKPAVVRNEASKLCARRDIAMTVERIREDRSRLEESRSIGDRERVLSHFRHWMEQGCDDPLKIRAAEGLARASGLFRDQTDVTVSSRDSTAVAGGWVRCCQVVRSKRKPSGMRTTCRMTRCIDRADSV